MSIAGFRSQNHPQQTGKRGAVDAVDDRGTDLAFFHGISDRFGGFTLDVAAAEHNTKCDRYYTAEDDGLGQAWSGRVWCNPPYSEIRPWVQKAWDEWESRDRMGGPHLIVMLLPANRVEQAWWQDLVEPYRDRAGSPLRVEFLRGRMRFDRPGWTKPTKGDRPPFGCCLLIWDGSSGRCHSVYSGHMCSLFGGHTSEHIARDQNLNPVATWKLRSTQPATEEAS